MYIIFTCLKNVNEEVQVETLKFEKDFAAQVDTLPTSLQRKDAFLFELQNTMKESKDNIEKLKESTASSNNTDETVSSIPVLYFSSFYCSIP